MSGFTNSATNSMVPTSSATSWPYLAKISGPLVATAVYIRPRIPIGAQLMTHRTAVDTALDRSPIIVLVVGAASFSAMPNTTAQNRMPM